MYDQHPLIIEHQPNDPWDARTEMSDWRHRPFTRMMSRGGFA